MGSWNIAESVFAVVMSICRLAKLRSSLLVAYSIVGALPIQDPRYTLRDKYYK